MKSEKATKAVSIINKIAFFFFVVLIFFIPIAPAVIESVFGVLMLLFIIRSTIERPSLDKIKSFFKNSSSFFKNN